MPILTSSREVVFINTNLPENRINVIKTKKQLSELDNDSIDVFMPCSLNAYVKRPKELENVCLADFFAEFRKSKAKNVKIRI